MAAARMPYSPIGWVDAQDLRRITNHRGTMRRYARRYKLKPLQSIVFVNKRMDLFRIIYMDGFGRMHLDLPEKDVGAQRLSVALGVSQELARLTRGNIKKHIEKGHLPRLEAKLERSKKVRAARKRKKK
jgi:hypothetical protein